LHPVFLLVRAKLDDVRRASEHMDSGHASQRDLKQLHPQLYSPEIDAESMVTNIQGLYKRLEAILKQLAIEIDGACPSGDAWHRDLVLQASLQTDERPAMISTETAKQLGELLSFRHAVRHNYASELRHEEVFRNLEAMQGLVVSFQADMSRFIEQFGTGQPEQEKTSP
jgi:hypothetical protein